MQIRNEYEWPYGAEVDGRTDGRIDIDLGSFIPAVLDLNPVHDVRHRPLTRRS